jgi:hypothetical protein
MPMQLYLCLHSTLCCFVEVHVDWLSRDLVLYFWPINACSWRLLVEWPHLLSDELLAAGSTSSGVWHVLCASCRMHARMRGYNVYLCATSIDLWNFRRPLDRRASLKFVQLGWSHLKLSFVLCWFKSLKMYRFKRSLLEGRILYLSATMLMSKCMHAVNAWQASLIKRLLTQWRDTTLRATSKVVTAVVACAWCACALWLHLLCVYSLCILGMIQEAHCLAVGRVRVWCVCLPCLSFA